MFDLFRGLVIAALPYSDSEDMLYAWATYEFGLIVPAGAFIFHDELLYDCLETIVNSVWREKGDDRHCKTHSHQ